MTLRIRYPELPPSSNHIYFNGNQLTKQAREYAERFSHFMVLNHGHELSDFNPEAVFVVVLHFHFETLVNEGWLKRDKSGERRAKSRYKKMDLSNRVKLVEDCVRDAIDIDDSHTLAIMMEKHHSPGDSHIEITVQEVDPTMFGIPKEYL